MLVWASVDVRAMENMSKVDGALYRILPIFLPSTFDVQDHTFICDEVISISIGCHQDRIAYQPPT
jgi:hypothetical protein